MVAPMTIRTMSMSSLFALGAESAMFSGEARRQRGNRFRHRDARWLFRQCQAKGTAPASFSINAVGNADPGSLTARKVRHCRDMAGPPIRPEDEPNQEYGHGITSLRLALRP